MRERNKLEAGMNNILSLERDVPIPASRFTHDAGSVVDDPGIDLVVELIGGVEPARSLVAAALKAGKPVVTANKELLANVGRELFEAAATWRVSADHGTSGSVRRIGNPSRSASASISSLS